MLVFLRARERNIVSPAVFMMKQAILYVACQRWVKVISLAVILKLMSINLNAPLVKEMVQ